MVDDETAATVLTSYVVFRHLTLYETQNYQRGRFVLT